MDGWMRSGGLNRTRESEVNCYIHKDDDPPFNEDFKPASG